MILTSLTNGTETKAIFIALNTQKKKELPINRFDHSRFWEWLMAKIFMDDKILQQHIKDAITLAKKEYRTPFIKIMRDSDIFKIIATNGFWVYFWQIEDEGENMIYYIDARTGEKAAPEAKEITYFDFIDKFVNEGLLAMEKGTPQFIIETKELKKVLTEIKKTKPIQNIINIKIKQFGKVLFTWDTLEITTPEHNKPDTKKFHKLKIRAKTNDKYVKMTLNVNYLLDALKACVDDLITISYNDEKILAGYCVIMQIIR